MTQLLTRLKLHWGKKKKKKTLSNHTFNQQTIHLNKYKQKHTRSMSYPELTQTAPPLCFVSVGRTSSCAHAESQAVVSSHKATI